MNPSEISALAARSGLDHIWRKVEAAGRLNGGDATELLSSSDILAIGAMADFARARIAGDEAATGKRPGTDVRDGTITLPLIYALEARPELATVLGTPGADDAAVAAVLGAVAESGALQRARGDALRYIGDARSVLDACSGTVERELLA